MKTHGYSDALGAPMRAGRAGPLRGGDRRQRELEFGRPLPPPAGPPA